MATLSAWRLATTASAGAALVAFSGLLWSSARTQLLSSEEAARLTHSEQEFAALQPNLRTRSIKRGPAIHFVAPEFDATDELRVSSPADVHISFVKSGAPVDMDTLNVSVRKGFFSISVTDDIVGYIDGTAVRASGLEIPQGRYQLELSIADTAGFVTNSSYKLRVTD